MFPYLAAQNLCKSSCAMCTGRHSHTTKPGRPGQAAQRAFRPHSRHSAGPEPSANPVPANAPFSTIFPLFKSPYRSYTGWLSQHLRAPPLPSAISFPSPMAGPCRHPPTTRPAFPERRGRNRPALLPALAASGSNLRQPFAGNPRSRASGTGTLYRACPAVPSRQEHRLQEEWRPGLCIELAAACCAL